MLAFFRVIFMKAKHKVYCIFFLLIKDKKKIQENTDLKLKLKQIQCKSNTDGKKIYVAVLKLLIKLYVSVKTITF